jgi:hypothetical protein
MARTRHSIHALAAFSAAAAFSVTTGITSASAQPLSPSINSLDSSRVTSGPVTGPAQTDPGGGDLVLGPLIPRDCQALGLPCPARPACTATSLSPEARTRVAPPRTVLVPPKCKQQGRTGHPHDGHPRGGHPQTTPSNPGGQPTVTRIQPERVEPTFTG